MNAMNEIKWYWLAVSGASVAASPIPLADPVVSPVPEQLFGYRSRELQLEAQQFLLEAPIEEVVAHIRDSIPQAIRDGLIEYRKPSRPEQPTRGKTIWMEQGVGSWK